MAASQAQTSAPDKLLFIQALRGIAALAVVAYHARVFIDGGQYVGIGSRVFGGGFTGVDLFFVLSGFIMVHTTYRQRGNLRSGWLFFIKRWARVWPVYVVAFICMWLITRGLPNPAFTVDRDQIFTTLTLRPLRPDGAAPFYGYPLLHVGWTLVYEFMFYTLFALSLATGRWRWFTLAALFAALLIVVPLATVGFVSFDAHKSYGLSGVLSVATNPMMWEFAFGVGIGLLYQTRLRIADRGVAMSLVALAIGVVLWQLWSGYRCDHGPLQSGIPMAVLVLTLAMLHKQAPMQPPRWLIWLGDVSFSLYLFHILPQMLPRQFKHDVLMNGTGYFVACVVAALVMAYWSHRYLEQGIAERLRRWLMARFAN